MTVDVERFRGVLGSWASGVTVVTTRSDSHEYGLTVSSFSSVSLDPLLVLVCIAGTNPLLGMVRESKRVAITLLAEDQEPVSRFFAQPGRTPVRQYDEFAMEQWVTGSPIVSGGIGALDCELHALVPGGDHEILVARVVEARYDTEKRPLVYYRRGYRRMVAD